MALLSSARKQTTLAPPLPGSNRLLNSAGIVLRRGQFSLVAAASNVGKSLLANNLTVFTPVPSVYFSLDSDRWTIETRTCAMLTGQTQDVVDKQMAEPSSEQYYRDKLHGADHVDWCFNSNADVEYLALWLNRYAEMWGDYPSLVIVDNIMNLVVDDEKTELPVITRELYKMARNTGAHLMALCHVKGAKENGNVPITLGDLLYNIGKLPEQVFGLHRNSESEIGLTVAKNRGGRARFTVSLPVYYDTASIGGFR